MHDRSAAEEEGRQTIKIGAKFTNENYDSPDRANDLALLKLDIPVI